MVTKEELDEMESYFQNRNLPEKITLEQGTTVTDVRKFIDNSLIILRQYRGPIHEPVFLRLQKLRNKLEADI